METKKIYQGTEAKVPLVFDVVCGMEVEKRPATQIAKLHGVFYYFCSNHCKQHFENNPERYVWE